MPTRLTILKIAGALGTSGTELAAAAEALLLFGAPKAETDSDPQQSVQLRTQAGTNKRWRHQREHIGSCLFTPA